MTRTKHRAQSTKTPSQADKRSTAIAYSLVFCLLIPAIASAQQSSLPEFTFNKQFLRAGQPVIMTVGSYSGDLVVESDFSNSSELHKGITDGNEIDLGVASGPGIYFIKVIPAPPLPPSSFVFFVGPGGVATRAELPAREGIQSDVLIRFIKGITAARLKDAALNVDWAEYAAENAVGGVKTGLICAVAVFDPTHQTKRVCAVSVGGHLVDAGTAIITQLLAIQRKANAISKEEEKLLGHMVRALPAAGLTLASPGTMKPDETIESVSTVIALAGITLQEFVDTPAGTLGIKVASDSAGKFTFLLSLK